MRLTSNPLYGACQYRWRWLFVICLATLMAWQASSAVAAELVGKVIAVADGDTVTVLDTDMLKHRIRLSGIDAPEKRQAFSQRSKQALSQAVFNRTVTVEWSKRDKYGRLVGKLILPDGRDANLRQIELGLAWHYKAYAEEQNAIDRSDYATAEDRAREFHVGLWSDLAPVPPWEFRKAARP